jgi:Flp pilus assembly pilin Flp
MVSPRFSFRCIARRKGRRGQTLVEYALILAFIAVVAIAVLMSMGNTISNTFGTVNVQLSKAQVGGAGRGG